MLHRLTVSGRIEAGKLVIDRARLAAELAQIQTAEWIRDRAAKAAERELKKNEVKK